MNGKRLACFTALCCLMIGEARAQTLLQRLSEQLNQQPNPPATRENLPPPVGLTPAAGQGRASLGIRVGPITESVLRDQRLVVRRGAVITAIEQGSAADRAGLPIGAVIVAFDGRRIDSPEDLVDSVRASRSGQEIEITYYDREKLARKRVQLAAASGPDLLLPNNRAVPLDPTPTNPGPATAPGPTLERQLGADGSRPLLGRIGRVIDSIAPAQAVEPAPTVAQRPEIDSEVLELRQQVDSLAKEVAALRKQVTSLEKKLSQKK
jgi:serine protease Do